MLTGEIRPGRGSSVGHGLTAFGDRLLLAASDFVLGTELWATTNESQEPLTRIKDIRPGSLGSYPAEFSQHRDMMYFQADDGVHGSELWMSDGTEEGTVLVVDATPGPDGTSPAGIHGIGNDLYFFSDGPFGLSLYRVDLTTHHSRRITSLSTAASDTIPESIMSVGDRLYFVLDDAVLGKELWTSDGTAAGTRLVYDVRAGLNGSNPKASLDKQWNTRWNLRGPRPSQSCPRE